MGTLSDYAENKLIDHAMKTASFTVPTNIYVALSTADPTKDGSGIAEPVGNNYARKLINNWDAAASRATENTDEIEMNEASGNWGTIAHWALFDAITGGNMLVYGSFTSPKTITSGVNSRIPVGDIDISFDSGGIATYLADALLDHLLKVSPYTQPNDIYVGLFTASPGDAGSIVNEIAVGNYARVNQNTWDAASGEVTQNTSIIQFVTANTYFGTITYYGMFDTLSVASNMMFYDSLTSVVTIANNDSGSFAVGALDLRFDH